MVREVVLQSDKKVNAGSAIGAAVGYGAAREVKGDYRSRQGGGGWGRRRHGRSKRFRKRRAWRSAIWRAESHCHCSADDLPIRAGDKVFLTVGAARPRCAD